MPIEVVWALALQRVKDAVARVSIAKLGQLDTWAERVISAQALADVIGRSFRRTQPLPFGVGA